jgi:hypothetical protein
MSSRPNLTVIEGQGKEDPSPAKRKLAKAIAPAVLAATFGLPAIFGGGHNSAPGQDVGAPVNAGDKDKATLNYDAQGDVSKYPTQGFTFTEPGQGTLDAIEAVDPGLSTSSTEVTQEVEAFIDKQDGDGIYQLNQTVRVPQVPVDPATHDPKG